MTVNKCDRCGEIYEKGSVMRFSVGKQGNAKRWDLCPRCSGEVDKWLKVYQNKAEREADHEDKV